MGGGQTTPGKGTPGASIPGKGLLDIIGAKRGYHQGWVRYGGNQQRLSRVGHDATFALVDH